MSTQGADVGASRIRPTSLRSYIITACVASTVSFMLLLSKPAVVRVDGQRLMSDVQPVTGVRETFLPLRAVGLGLGAVTSFDKRSGRIEVLRGRDTLVLRVGDHHALLNGIGFTFSQAPFVVRGRVMVPVALFERALRANVRYEGDTIDVMPAGAQREGERPENGSTPLP